MARRVPPTRLPKELDLPTAFELTRKLVTAEATPATDPAPRRGLIQGVSYWLWRLGGRRRPALTDMSHFAKLADHYDRDMEYQRARVAELEKLTSQLQAAYERKMADLRQQHERELAQAQSRPTPDQSALESRAEAAEERARLAENKVELLKEALDITRARNDGKDGSDPRFREAKRAFARQFHPDQGGRDDPEKQRSFLEFWPVLEKIEKEG